MNSYKKAYENLYSSVYENSANFPESNTANFVAMKGTRFDANQIKLLLVGRATNGWDRGLRRTDKESFSKTAAELFCKN
jgi:hypothetical protein